MCVAQKFVNLSLTLQRLVKFVLSLIYQILVTFWISHLATCVKTHIHNCTLLRKVTPDRVRVGDAKLVR